MATPSMPAIQASPTPTEIDPVSQANADEAAKFIQGIMPSDVEISDEQIEKIKTENNIQ